MSSIGKMTFLLLMMFWCSPCPGDEDSCRETWATWRGNRSDGSAPGCKPPVRWSENENVKWKTRIPGKGHSSPVIWGDRVFLTTSVELDKRATREAFRKQKNAISWLWMYRTTKNYQRLIVYCISRSTGKVLWEKVAKEQFPHEGRHKNGSWASPSCVTDGSRVIASFGSFGIYCLDFDGNLVWERDLGNMNILDSFGEGSSPALHRNAVIFVWDHLGESRIVALDKHTGEDLWTRRREENATWATPVVIEVKGTSCIVVPGQNASIGYCLKTGTPLWSVEGSRQEIVASPVHVGNRAFITGSKLVQAIDIAVMGDAKGVTAKPVWTHKGGTPYVSSPVYSEGRLYCLKGNAPLMTCVDEGGKVLYRLRKIDGLGEVFSSPVCANERLYVTDRNGNCAVIRQGDQFSVEAVNKLSDTFSASPAVAGNELLFRGESHLYCIAE